MDKKMTAEQSQYIANSIIEYMELTKGSGFELTNELRTYLLNNPVRKIPLKFRKIFKDMMDANTIGIIFV